MVVVWGWGYLWWLLPAAAVAGTRAEADDCDVQVQLGEGSRVNITITDRPVHEVVVSTWCISSPQGTVLSLSCDADNIPKSPDCDTSAFMVSFNKDESRTYCGENSLHVNSRLNEMAIMIQSSEKSRGGKYFCRLTADTNFVEDKMTQDPPIDSVAHEEQTDVSVKAIVYQNCDCGYSYKMRIVGGEEASINEYPSMAGLVDSRRGAVVWCGATIISERYVLTAEHCLSSLVEDKTGVLIGDHNTRTGSETDVTKLLRVKRFVHYPFYSKDSKRYDIALVELTDPIVFTERVGPVCLPFQSKDWNLQGNEVTILGWGTTEFGGPRSKYLKKANVDIIDIAYCIKSYGNDIDPYTQLCAWRKNNDACQYDSGGPLMWYNYYTNRHELVGVISYGRACAASDPSVNTYVAPFLQWILDSTPTEVYCYKYKS